MKQILIIAIFLILLASCVQQSIDASNLIVTLLPEYDPNKASQEIVASLNQSRQTSIESSVDQGGLAPDFTLYNQTGNPTSHSDYQGKIVFLNFFASWHKYCNGVFPVFQQASDNYGGDIVFLLIDSYKQESI